MKVVLAFVALAGVAHADDAKLVSLAGADDARRATAIGPNGQVFAGDGKGAWVRTLPVTIAGTIDSVTRGTFGVLAGADGAVYKLAANGWTAVRLAQKGRAIGGRGRAVAAVGRDIFDLDKGELHSGEPAKLATAPSEVLAIAAGPTGIVIRTSAGVARMPGAKPIANVPADARLVGDRWAVSIDRRGAFDMRAGKLVAWPAGVTVDATSQAPDGTLAVVAHRKADLVLLRIDAKVVEEAIALPAAGAGSGPPVGIVVDRQQRVAIAFRDGTIALKERGTWALTSVTEALPPDRPGAPPATTP